MFEELNTDTGFTVESVEKTPQRPPDANRSYQNQDNNRNDYQQRQGNNRSYGNSNNQGQGQSGFQRREDPVQEPYVPVAIYVEKDFPEEAKTSLFNIASKLIAKKITVRINGDDKEFVAKVMALSNTFTELYLPWRGFNELESKHTYNTSTSKHVASVHFMSWDKIPDSVKAILAAQVRLVFGDKNNSVAMCLITWTKDGASRPAEINKDTGRASFIIKTASSYGFPVLNISKQSSGPILEKSFGI